jgi:hypothetical protein
LTPEAAGSPILSQRNLKAVIFAILGQFEPWMTKGQGPVRLTKVLGIGLFRQDTLCLDRY